jgi:DNA-binding CsgD family transcriptional regulator
VSVVVTLHDGRCRLIWASSLDPGVQESDVLGKFPWEMALPKDREMVRGAFALALLDGLAFSYSATYRLGGREFTYRTHLWPTGMEAIPIVAVAARIPDELAKLSDREWEVMRLYAKGLTTRQIARKLKLHTSTITTHRGHIAKKLGFTGRNVEQVIAFATAHFSEGR